MDSKHLKSSRSSRKLNFLPNKESSPKQRGRRVTLDTVDRLFDNLDSSFDGFNSIIPLSPMPITTSGAKEKEEIKIEAPSSDNIQTSPLGPKGEPQPPAAPVKNTEHNLVGLEASSPLVEHCPVKTSSPLEGKHQRCMEASPDRFLWDREGVPEDQSKTDRPSMARAHSSEPFQPPPASSELPVWRPGPQLPSTSSGSRTSFIQKLRATGLSRAPRGSPIKEPAPPWEPQEEPEEEFLISDEDPPAWITIPRKMNPSSYKQKGPDALPVRNDYGVSQPSTPDWALGRETGQKAETWAPGCGGEPAGLEEGRAGNSNKKKKEKAAAPSLPSPKKSAWKRAKSKGTDSQTEMVKQESSLSSNVVDNAEDYEKKKPGRKKVTKESMPSHSRPMVQPPHHSSPSHVVKLKVAPTRANNEPSNASVPKKSQSTKGPRQEVKEKKKKTKAEKAVKRRKREDLPASNTQEEQIQQESKNIEAEHFTMGLAIPEVGPLLTSEVSSPVPGKRNRKRPGERWLSPPSSPEEPGALPALKAQKLDPRIPKPRAAEPLLGSPEPAPDRGTGRSPRIRNSPGEWWKLSDALPDGDILPQAPPPAPTIPPPPTPPPQSQKARKGGRPSSKQGARPPSKQGGSPPSKQGGRPPSKQGGRHPFKQGGRPQSKQRGRPQSKQGKSLTPPTPQNAPETTTTTESKPFKRGNIFSAPKTIQRSLAMFQDIFSQTAVVSPPDDNREEAEGGKRSRRKRPNRDSHIRPLDALNSSGPPLIIEAPAGPSCSTRLSWPSNIAPPQPSKRPSASMGKGFQSGPSSLVDLEQHEEDELTSPQWTRTQSSYWLSLGLYAPPLIPMVLQEQDAANLEEWLSLLWPALAQEPSSQASSDYFEWFCHQGRVIGLQMDMCLESMCNGKIILSSSMKKPLWVDHCATTVFFVSTSCVFLTLNAADFLYRAGQSFLVPSGHAYSLENPGDEPAVLFFSRVQV